MPRRDVDWSDALDVQLALRNCHTDILKDWYRDPWGWAEIDWVAKKKVEILLGRLNSGGVRRAAKINVAKENFATRPALILDPVDRLAYEALVDALSVKLVGDAAAFVFGWRLPLRGAKKGRYLSQSDEWDRFRRHLGQLVDLRRAALKTDIVACFPSISVESVSDEVSRRAGDTRLTQRLGSFLEGWNAIPGRSGLPQRSLASCVLANMYLQPLDDSLASHAKRRGPILSQLSLAPVARWMDDIWAFSNGLGTLRSIQLELQQRMVDLGLNMNLGKTEVIQGRELENAARSIEHSDVDQQLGNTPMSTAALDELLDRILAKPETADRTSIKFATVRMRKHGLFGRVDEIVDKAQRMPHASDALARLFRDSGKWRELADWYISYVNSSWGKIDWSVAQFGTMFPAIPRNRGTIRDYFAEVLLEHPPVALGALAAQRLASWDKTTARAVFREAAERSDHPLERRAIAISAVAAGEERPWIKALLREFEENAVTLGLLDARSFRPLKPKADFEGG